MAMLQNDGGRRGDQGGHAAVLPARRTAGSRFNATRYRRRAASGLLRLLTCFVPYDAQREVSSRSGAGKALKRLVIHPSDG